MCSGGDASAHLSEIADAGDPRVAEVARLLQRTFADPNTVLGEDRMREFLTDRRASRFHILVAESDRVVVGCSVFSYVPASRCGFSEYLVVDQSLRKTGLGRQLFDARKAILDNDAEGACRGLFIEVDSPVRTPPELLAAETMDARERLRIFTHLGFRKVDLSYVQPPLRPAGETVDYLDLLFAPWTPLRLNQIPSTWVLQTLEVIWSAWAPQTYATYLVQLRQQIGDTEVRLLDAE